MINIRYNQIRSMDISNGEGVGISLFVQGCHFHCENCFNKETWSFNGGNEWTKETEQYFLNLADKPYIKRITILGGEPLEKCNLAALNALMHNIKVKFNDTKQIWVYTGYTFDELKNNRLENLSYELLKRDVLKKCDVLVDGQYIAKLRDITLKWRGSSNQRVIDVKKSLANDKIVLWCD